MKTKKVSVQVEVIDSNQSLTPAEARREVGASGTCVIISHEIKSMVSYLIEYPNGSRSWASKPVMRSQAEEEEDDH